ncbi:MAG: D-alanine--D-alanine ligase family protein [Patescibacteria group bacterium]
MARKKPRKISIGVLFGGKSAEHDVSVVSARNVISALNKNKYKVTPIKIGKEGNFNFEPLKKLDVVFPVLHGPFGEDGSMQGLLKLAGVPFVGPGVLGSAVGMDKDVMKRLLRDAKVPIGKFITVRSGEKMNFDKVKKELGLPLFIKPANMGSSVGISKVKGKKDFDKAVKLAFKFDTKIVIEKNIKGREIECAVLGNDKPKASVLGEIIPVGDFYSYDAKYVDDSKTLVKVKLPENIKKKIQVMAIKVFQVLECEGMSRVDFFLTPSGQIFVNEINTIPGFTGISMYPKLWEASGVPTTVLLDKLIHLAMQRHKGEAKLQSTI